jgi:hypothetical protein
VTGLGFFAFRNCSSLEKVVIGNGVRDIPGGFQSGEDYYGCFSGCTNLLNVVIGNSVTHIGSYAFAGCSSLSSIIIPASVTHISGHAFLGTSLYGLLFMGEPPYLEPNSETSLPDDLVLYYIEGIPGWVPFTWGGFSVETWLPDPWILEQPFDQSVTAGERVTFNVSVNIWSPLYQWFKDGVAIEGARAASYTIQAAKVSDSGRYSLRVTSESGSVTSRDAILTVNKGTPTLVWENPQPIVYGTALSETELNAATDMPGAFMYQPWIGTKLPAGTHILGVTFLPLDSINYGMGFSTAILIVEKATPEITWVTPAAINYGTALNGNQLNASADVDGVAVYSPGPGTLLEVGTHTLSVTFTPEDTANYAVASAQVELVVQEESEPPALSFEVKDGKLILTFSGGKLEASNDLIHWNPVEGALGGTYEVELPATGKTFYRVAQ